MDFKEHVYLLFSKKKKSGGDTLCSFNLAWKRRPRRPALHTSTASISSAGSPLGKPHSTCTATQNISLTVSLRVFVEACCLLQFAAALGTWDCLNKIHSEVLWPMLFWLPSLCLLKSSCKLVLLRQAERTLSLESSVWSLGSESFVESHLHLQPLLAVSTLEDMQSKTMCFFTSQTDVVELAWTGKKSSQIPKGWMSRLTRVSSKENTKAIIVLLQQFKTWDQSFCRKRVCIAFNTTFSLPFMSSVRSRPSCIKGQYPLRSMWNGGQLGREGIEVEELT